MALNQVHGTLTTDGSTGAVLVRPNEGVTCSAHYDSGSGTMTWEFRGPDNVWRTIYGGAGNTTAQAYTATHVANFGFCGQVEVRGTLSGSSTPQIDYQIWTG